MSTKVLIDGRWAGNTGIGRLYKEVMQLRPQQADCSYVNSQMGLGNLLSPLMLHREIKQSQAEVFYSPSFMPPLRSTLPFIFTIHDLMHVYHYSAMHRVYYRQVIARLARKAHRIITVSEFSKQLLVKELKIPEQLIVVIYNGVDTVFSTNTEKANLGRPYFLYVGNRRSYKNIPAMLEAFARAKIPDDFLIALSGNEDPQLAGLIKKLGIEQRVRFLGFIEEDELPKFYKGAHGVLFASLMEGFGLPLLESMASGTPVLTSTTSSLPEVAGGAALCVNPNEVAALADGMEKLVNDEALYEDLVKKGMVRAKEFSWETTATKTWKTILS